MILVELATHTRLAEHIVGEMAFANHHIIDFQIELRGRLGFVLARQGIDDELQIGWRIGGLLCDMPFHAYYFAVGEHQALVGKQVVDANAGAEFLHKQQGVAFLVGHKHLVQHQIVEWSNAHRPNFDIRAKQLRQFLLALAAHIVLHRRHRQHNIQRGKKQQPDAEQRHYHHSQALVYVHHRFLH